MRPRLSGLGIEYAILQVYSRDAGQRSARSASTSARARRTSASATTSTSCSPPLPVHHVSPARARRERPADDGVVPDSRRAGPDLSDLSKRLAPDFFFQPQIYRADGETVDLPSGDFTVDVYTRARVPAADAALERSPAGAARNCRSQLERWIDPAALRLVSPATTTSTPPAAPTTRTRPKACSPQDMMRHILGEDLDVGCVLTWGPWYYYQKQFFAARTTRSRQPRRLMHYDVEVSGFPSSHAGHLVLLGLKEQDYPGDEADRGMAELDLPVLHWAQVAGRGRRLRAFGLGPGGAQHGSARTTRCRASTASAPTNTSSTSPTTPSTSSRRSTRRPCGS